MQRGYDATEYALCCFGGAGGQHACLVADALGMKTILIHPYAGVLSAYGMGLADTVVDRQQAVESVLDATLLTTLSTQLHELEVDGAKELEAQGEKRSRQAEQFASTAEDGNPPCRPGKPRVEQAQEPAVGMRKSPHESTGFVVR